MKINKILCGSFSIALLCLLFSCSQNEAKPKTSKTSSKISKATEKAIERGIEEAKKTLQSGFLDVYEAKEEGNYNYSIKMAFRSFTEEEHIWLDNIRYDNSNTLIGFLANEPKKLTHIKSGEQLKIVFEDIVDWMYLKDDVLYGGYTIKALRENMTDAQKAAFDEKSGFKIID